VQEPQMMLGSINWQAYQQIAQASSMVDRFIQEALVIKSHLGRMPLLEDGTGRYVNIIA
jgi:hypothetical protein